MRRLALAFAIAAASLLTVLSPNHAGAAPLAGTAAAIGGAVANEKLAQEAAYVCRRVCGRYGCARRCWWTAPRYYRPYYRPYRPYYYYRPYRYYW
jgi:hypothetical protein